MKFTYGNSPIHINYFKITTMGAYHIGTSIAYFFVFCCSLKTLKKTNIFVCSSVFLLTHCFFFSRWQIYATSTTSTTTTSAFIPLNEIFSLILSHSVLTFTFILKFRARNIIWNMSFLCYIRKQIERERARRRESAREREMSTLVVCLFPWMNDEFERILFCQHSSVILKSLH